MRSTSNMGALTIKPLAYKARSWELSTIEILNVLESYSGNIIIQKRGEEIIRILPTRKENFFWITDKIRFFFESLKKQRITFPYIYYKEKYIKINWKTAITFIKYKKYILEWLEEVEKVNKELGQKNVIIAKNVVINNMKHGLDIISYSMIKKILSKINRIKYEKINMGGNINSFFSETNLLNNIQQGHYKIINNLCIINDYPQIWQKIKFKKIFTIGKIAEKIFGSIILNINKKEINLLEKGKSRISLLSKDIQIFTEEKLKLNNIKQIILTKNLDNLINNWVDNKVDFNKIRKDLIKWNLLKDNKKNINKNEIQISFQTHGNQDINKSSLILPNTTFVEENIVRIDNYGQIKKSIPAITRKLNMRSVNQILQLYKNIFVKNEKDNLRLIQDIGLLTYGEILERAKPWKDYIFPRRIKTTPITVTLQIQKDPLFEHSEIIQIKKNLNKKKNNY